MSRKCTECGDPLPNNSPESKKTCSQKCRSKRSRRLAAQRKGPASSHSTSNVKVYGKGFVDVANDEVENTARDLVREELKPIVREAITEDVLRAINDLVGLTPKTVSVLKEQLDSPDEQMQHKAAALVMKYTVGNSAVSGSPSEDSGKLDININVPRPVDTQPLQDVPEINAEGEDIQECENCRRLLTLDQFIDNTDRCKDCHAELQAKVRETLGLND